MDAFQRRLGQEDEIASNQSREIAGAAQQAIGAARVSASEGNVQGRSINVLLNSYAAIAAENDRRVSNRLAWMRQQGQAEMGAARASTASQINAATPQPLSNPSLLSLGLGLAGTGLGAYGAASQQLGLDVDINKSKVAKFWYGDMFNLTKGR
jgi:hypothetical protein